MLPFKNRLTKRKDFDSVRKSGLFFSNKNITIRFIANELTDTRVGVVVGIKFSKKAVERSQAKKQLREIIQRRIGQLKRGMDIVVTARRRENERVNFKKVEQSIDLLLKQGGLVK